MGGGVLRPPENRSPANARDAFQLLRARTTQPVRRRRDRDRIAPSATPPDSIRSALHYGPLKFLPTIPRCGRALHRARTEWRAPRLWHLPPEHVRPRHGGYAMTL